MRLIRYDYPQFPSNRPLNRFFDLDFPGFGRFGNVFNTVLADGAPTEPRADTFEDSDNYYTRLELPGMKKDQISLELENTVLTVSGARSEETGGGKEAYRFSRSVSVPDDANLTSIRAGYQDGVLTITMPKKEIRKPRQIAVN